MNGAFRLGVVAVAGGRGTPQQPPEPNSDLWPSVGLAWAGLDDIVIREATSIQMIDLDWFEIDYV